MIFCLAGTLTFNDQTNTNNNRDFLKHLSTQHESAQKTSLFSLSSQGTKESASKHSFKIQETNVLPNREEEFRAITLNTDENTNNISKNSHLIKTTENLDHDNIQNEASSLKLHTNILEPTQVGLQPRSNHENGKIATSKKYSFENELPVRDPGPHTPEIAAAPIRLGEPRKRIASLAKTENQLKSEVEELFLRHQEDLKLVQDSNIGINLPSPLHIMANLTKQAHSKTSKSVPILRPMVQTPTKHAPERAQPDVVPAKEITMQTHNYLNGRGNRILISSSEVEEAPPQIHFAETPDLAIQLDNSVDPFNFMSTVQRKLIVRSNSTENDINFNPTKESIRQTDMVLSEGPLSSSLASSHQPESDERNNNPQSNIAHENGKQRLLNKNINGDLNLDIKKPTSRQEIISNQNDESRRKANVKNSSKPFAKTSDICVPDKKIGSAKKEPENLSNILPAALPSSLQLRFQAELNHMESIQEAERQLNQINQLKDMISAANKKEAHKSQDLSRKHSARNGPKRNPEKQKESRVNFEKRVKKELHELINNRMQNLLTSQTEATKVTADAAKQLVELHKSMKSQDTRNSQNQTITSAGISLLELKELMKHGKQSSDQTRSSKDFQSKKNLIRNQTSSKRDESRRNEIPDHLVTLISKAESNIPEVLSIIEKTDKSGSSIQKTISEVIHQLSVDEKSSKSGNITEDIAKEIESDYTSQFLDDEESNTLQEYDTSISESNKRLNIERKAKNCKPDVMVASNRGVKQTGLTKDSSSSNLSPNFPCATNRQAKASSDLFTNKIFEQHLLEENLKSQKQYALLKGKEKMLAEKTASELEKIQIKKTELTSHFYSNNIEDETLPEVANGKLQRLNEKERKITERYEEKSKELKDLKLSIKVEEKNRKRMIEQQNTFLHEGENFTASYSHKELDYSEPSTTSSKAAAKKREIKNRNRKNHNLSVTKKSVHQDPKMSLDEHVDDSQDSNAQESLIREEKEINHDLKGRDTTSSPTSRKENLKKKIGGHVTPLKAPLSPKSSKRLGPSKSPKNFTAGVFSTTRKRHSSAGSSTDDSLSISQAETISSDHSDMEIRINTLQEELKKRMMTANKLKRQQKIKKREKLRVQEEALKKQIEAYDSLILKTKADLEESINSTSLVIVQPQIKTPKESLEKTYEREDNDQIPLKSIPLSAPAALFDVPPTWPNPAIKKINFNDNENLSSRAFAVNTETGDSSPIPPLAISSRESSIDTILTSSHSKTPDIPTYIPTSNIWCKNAYDSNEDREQILHSTGDEKLEKSLSGESANKRDQPIMRDKLNDRKLSLPTENLDKELELEITNNLNYSDDFTCNISTTSETPSSDANVITVSPTKTLTIEKEQVQEETTWNEIRSEETLENKIDASVIPDHLPIALEMGIEKATDNIGHSETLKIKDTSFKDRSALNSKTVDSICDKLMNDLMKDTYSSLKAATQVADTGIKASRLPVQTRDTSKTYEKVSKIGIPKENDAEFIPKQISNNLSKRKESRPQDLMLSTFDLSSDSSSEETPNMAKNNQRSDITTHDLDEQTETCKDDKEGDNHDFEGGGHYIDDDLLQQESEQIRQQQILIEKEINRIQQERGVVSLRDIPDKPPPPYTPPSSPSTKGLRLRFRDPEIVRYVPSSKLEVLELCNQMSRIIYQLHEVSKNSIEDDSKFLRKLMDATLPVELLQIKDKCAPPYLGSGDNLDNDSTLLNSHNMFISFVFDLVKEISALLYTCETEKQNYIWMTQKPLAKAKLALPKDSASLSAIVCREVMVAFGYEKRASKENLIVRWSPQKRRDRVDQILVRELHSEEKEWTDYSQDETIVKDSVADSLFELLLTDTVVHVKQTLVK